MCTVWDHWYHFQGEQTSSFISLLVFFVQGRISTHHIVRHMNTQYPHSSLKTAYFWDSDKGRGTSWSSIQAWGNVAFS